MFGRNRTALGAFVGAVCVRSRGGGRAVRRAWIIYGSRLGAADFRDGTGERTRLIDIAKLYAGASGILGPPPASRGENQSHSSAD
jgi:hypothetical protein